MSTCITKFSNYIRSGKLTEAKALVRDWPIVHSGDITMQGGTKTKLNGTILHISKGKKVHMLTKYGNEKRVKKEVSYYRLVFLRLSLGHIELIFLKFKGHVKMQKSIQ